jgi:hypothetical protein
LSSSPLTTYSLPFSPLERWLLLLLPIGVAACILAGVYAPTVLLLAVIALFAAIFLERPYELLLVMVFLIPFNFVFAIGPVPIAVELLKLFLWIPFLVTRTARADFKTSTYNKWFAVWAFILATSVIRSNDLPYTIKESIRLASNIGLCYLVLNLVDTREKLLQIVRVLTMSTLLVACYGFYQWAIQDYGALFWIVNPRIDTNLAHYRDTFWPWRNRMISVLTSEMELGHYFNMCLPIGLMLWLTEGRKRLSSKWFWSVLAMLAGLLLTFTFGAWAALPATMGLFVVVLDKKLRWKLLGGVLVISVVSGLLIMGPLRPFAETKFSGQQIGSFTWDIFTRLKAWTFAVNTWRSHPMLGVGVGSYETISAESDWLGVGPMGAGSSPHETYLYLLAESGLIGFISMMAIFISSIRRNLEPRFGLIGVALAFSIAVNLMGGFSDDSGFNGPHASYLLWLVIGLSEALRGLTPALQVRMERAPT